MSTGSIYYRLETVRESCKRAVEASQTKKITCRKKKNKRKFQVQGRGEPYLLTFTNHYGKANKCALHITEKNLLKESFDLCAFNNNLNISLFSVKILLENCLKLEKVHKIPCTWSLKYKEIARSRKIYLSYLKIAIYICITFLVVYGCTVLYSLV